MKGYLCLFAFVVLLVGQAAEAYVMVNTDGSHIFLDIAEYGTNGKLDITSEFSYAAPGTIGSLAILPAPGSTGNIIKFDVVGTFNDSGKPVLFRDRLELDTTTSQWNFVSRKTYPTHKLDSYNTFSGSASSSQRLVLTENGSTVNTSKVTNTGTIKGKNKPLFKNPSSADPLSAALSPDGSLAVQSMYTGSAFVFSIKDLETNQLAQYQVSRQMINHSVYRAPITTAGAQAGVDCSIDKEAQGDPGSGSRMAVQTGVFKIDYVDGTLQPEKITTISKMKATTDFNREYFNTTILLPDATAVVYGKTTKGTLKYFVQNFNGPCGSKLGKPYKLPVTNNRYAWAAAACYYPNLC